MRRARDRIDDLHLIAEPDRPRRLAAHLHVVIEGADAGADPDFGHAVAGDGAYRCQNLIPVPGDRRGAVHAGGHQTRSQRRDVARLGLLRFGERLKMRLETVHERNLLAFDDVETLSWIESFCHDLPRTGHRCHEDSFGVTEGVEHRQIVQNRILLRDTHAEAAIFHVADEFVAMHDALRESCGPGCIHDQGGIVRANHINPLRKCVVADGFAGFQSGCPCHNAVRIDLVGNHDAFQF
ncbi:MAG: hypothetical protein CMM59_05210 [Rhodospirillaceae bacterium]|nr:hypothetical protein [Rhodospirillaceae bacterium]